MVKVGVDMVDSGRRNLQVHVWEEACPERISSCAEIFAQMSGRDPLGRSFTRRSLSNSAGSVHRNLVKTLLKSKVSLHRKFLRISLSKEIWSVSKEPWSVFKDPSRVAPVRRFLQ